MTARRPATPKTPAKTAKSTAKSTAKKSAARRVTSRSASSKKSATRKATQPEPKKRTTRKANRAPGSGSGSQGPVEIGTRADLEKLGVTDMGLAQSAILMARHADRAETSTTAAQAARELRMTMSNIRAMTWPTPAAKNDDQAGEGTVVPRSRLEAARRKAARRART